MGAYHNPKELHTLMKMLIAEFPEAIRPINVGKTYENKTIHGFAVGLGLNGTNSTDWTQDALARPAILLTGAHHARELTSIEMTYYTMIRLLFDYVHGDKQAIQILKDSVIFVIPVVNVDSFDAIATHFNKTKQLVAIRKNRHKYPTQEHCAFKDIGVDLNRNYPYMFAHDSEGSSGAADACKDDYRGPEPFSEPETRAIADFVTKWSNLKVVINFHAYGNLFIYPFNYDTESNSELHQKYPLAAKFFKHLFEDGGVPEGSIQGNGQETI